MKNGNSIFRMNGYRDKSNRDRITYGRTERERDRDRQQVRSDSHFSISCIIGLHSILHFLSGSSGCIWSSLSILSKTIFNLAFWSTALCVMPLDRKRCAVNSSIFNDRKHITTSKTILIILLLQPDHTCDLYTSYSMLNINVHIHIHVHIHVTQ